MTNISIPPSREQINGGGLITPSWGRWVNLIYSSVKDLLNYLKLKNGGNIGIVSGIVTITSSYHTIDTESLAATDNLDTINGGIDGLRIVVRANNSARTVVLKNGTGNLVLPADLSLDNATDTAEFIYDASFSKWLMLSSSNNGA